MVTKCANPSCTKILQYFRGGNLVLFAQNSRVTTSDADFQERGCDTEYLWLCGQCALTMTIVSDECSMAANDDKDYIDPVQIGTEN